MRALSIVSFALAVTVASSATAQTASIDVPADAPEPSQKVICVRTQAETGSHFGASKVCHTESEWEMIHKQTERTMERYDTVQNKQPPRSGN
jgi:hypothetical protein